MRISVAQAQLQKGRDTPFLGRTALKARADIDLSILARVIYYVDWNGESSMKTAPLATPSRSEGTSRPLIIDVGGNNGDDTAFYLHRGYRVVMVEANPLLAEHLRGRFAARGCRERRHRTV